MPYADPEKRREYQRLWQQGYRAKNPEKHVESVLAWQAKNREKVREYQKKAARRRVESGARAEYEYRLPRGAFDALWLSQDGKCAVCTCELVRRRADGRKWACVDHDHETGEVRALLCQACNGALGLLQDSAQTAQRAADYLKRFGR